MKTVTVDLALINDWKSFHEVFKRILGFPDFYGNNMNAWIDCMTYLDEDTGMANVVLEESEILVIQLNSVEDFKKRCSEIFEALIDSIAFVNYRRLELGQRAILALSYF